MFLFLLGSYLDSATPHHNSFFVMSLYQRIGLLAEHFRQHHLWGWIIVAIAITACSPDRQQVQSQPPASSASSPASTSTSQPSIQSQDGEADEQQAAQVIYQYYDAINRQDYARAYAYWSENGNASHQSFDQFKQGFANTSSVEVNIGEPGSIQGAAGSSYVTILVTITATTIRGATQHFQGSYTLRRTNDIPGSTIEERMWHLYSAQISQVS